MACYDLAHPDRYVRSAALCGVHPVQTFSISLQLMYDIPQLFRYDATLRYN